MSTNEHITTANGQAVRQAISMHTAAHADGEPVTLDDCLAAAYAQHSADHSASCICTPCVNEVLSDTSAWQQPNALSPEPLRMLPYKPQPKLNGVEKLAVAV